MEAQFDRFVASRQGSLVRLGWALTGDRHTGEDLAQACLSRLWPRWERVASAGDPWAYTQRIAVTLASTWRRRRWRSSEQPAGIAPPGTEAFATVSGDGFEDSDTRSVVAGWLRQLPARQRAVVALRFMFDQSIEETAAVLRCSPGTVKSQTSKALATLRSLAGPDPFHASEGAEHG
jgi:RNA polymerase sigma-70 factor (sigma-E family)